jgi:sortase A
MRARLNWKDDGHPGPKQERQTLRALEWVFLIAGLLAVDCFVWINTSSVLYQAYEDWAFDQTLRGLKPTVGGFASDESRWLFSGSGREKVQTPESSKSEPGVKEAPSEAPNQGRPARRSVIGRLEIPRLRLAVMVREGADESTLSRAVGHIPGTALPGNVGNVGLAGHRDTFFRALRNIHADDTIDLETTARKYRYIVKSTRIVTPRDVSVLEASGGETLTLVTCYPFYYVGSAPKRFIVRAALMHEAPEVTATQQRQPLPGS